jgi:hypothetical protein
VAVEGWENFWTFLKGEGCLRDQIQQPWMLGWEGSDIDGGTESWGGTMEEGVSGTGVKGVITPLLRIHQSTSACETTDTGLPSSNMVEHRQLTAELQHAMHELA